MPCPPPRSSSRGSSWAGSPAVAAVPGARAAAAAASRRCGGPARLRRALDLRAVAADPRWVAAAAGFEPLSFGGDVALLWLVGGRATRRIDARRAVEVTLGGAAAMRLLPTAGVGGAAMTLWALPAHGHGQPDRGANVAHLPRAALRGFFGSIAVVGAR